MENKTIVIDLVDGMIMTVDTFDDITIDFDKHIFTVFYWHDNKINQKSFHFGEVLSVHTFTPYQGEEIPF